MTDLLMFKLDKFGKATVFPKGRSMLPYLKEKRDCVLIVPAKNKIIKKYDIVLYNDGEDYVLHRVIEIKNNYYIICGDNCRHTENVKKSRIIGIVSKVYTGERKRKFMNVFPVLWYDFHLKKLAFICKNLKK